MVLFVLLYLVAVRSVPFYFFCVLLLIMIMIMMSNDEKSEHGLSVAVALGHFLNSMSHVVHHPSSLPFFVHIIHRTNYYGWDGCAWHINQCGDDWTGVIRMPDAHGTTIQNEYTNLWVRETKAMIL